MEKVTLVGSANISKVYERLRKIDSVKDGKVDNVISREELDEARKEGVDTTIEFKEGKASSLDALQRLYIILQGLDKEDGAFDGDIKELEEHLSVALTAEQKAGVAVSFEVIVLDKPLTGSEIVERMEKGLAKDISGSGERAPHLDTTDILRLDSYRKVAGRLIDNHRDIDPYYLYSLFYCLDSEKRMEAVMHLKEKGVFETVEKERAQYLMEELFGKSFGDDINTKLMKLIDVTRFKNFGWLWETRCDYAERTEQFQTRANLIAHQEDFISGIESLKILRFEDLCKLLRILGEPDHYFISWVITDAGNYAAHLLARRIKYQALKNINLNILLDGQKEISKEFRDRYSNELNLISAISPELSQILLGIPSLMTDKTGDVGKMLEGLKSSEDFERFMTLGNKASMAILTALGSDNEGLRIKAERALFVLVSNTTDINNIGFLNNNTFMLSLVKFRGAFLQFASGSLKKDKAAVLSAVKQDGRSLAFADISLRKDKQIVMAAIEQRWDALRFADDSLRKDKQFVMAAIKQRCWALQYADDSLKRDKEFVLAAIKEGGRALQYADVSLRKDREVVLAAVKRDGRVLQFADDSLKRDREVVLSAVNQIWDALQYADISLKRDEGVILASIAKEGRALQYADDSLKRNKDFMLTAIKQFAYALQYADDSLKRDKEIVLAAIKEDGRALQYADVSLRRDKEVVFAAIKQDGYSLGYADLIFRKDKEAVFIAVAESGFALQFADYPLKRDKEVVLAAVNQAGNALHYADESLRKDREVVLAAVKNSGRALEYADVSLRRDKEVVFAAIKQDGEALYLADISLKKDKAFILAAVKLRWWVLQYADESMKRDPDILAVYNAGLKEFETKNSNSR